MMAFTYHPSVVGVVSVAAVEGAAAGAAVAAGAAGAAEAVAAEGAAAGTAAAGAAAEVDEAAASTAMVPTTVTRPPTGALTATVTEACGRTWKHERKAR